MPKKKAAARRDGGGRRTEGARSASNGPRRKGTGTGGQQAKGTGTGGQQAKPRRKRPAPPPAMDAAPTGRPPQDEEDEARLLASEASQEWGEAFGLGEPFPDEETFEEPSGLPSHATEFQDPWHRGVNVPPGYVPAPPDTPVGAAQQMVEDPAAAKYYTPSEWDIERGAGWAENVRRGPQRASHGMAQPGWPRGVGLSPERRTSAPALDDEEFHATLVHRGKGPQGYQRADERILEDICDRLTEDRRIDATHVVVGVEEGEVTLSGWVASRALKHLAEDVVAACAGVRQVHNRLKIGRPPGEQPTAS